MGVRNAKREELNRLSCKTLDAQFKSTIRDGLNCSPFEAEAVLQVVHQVYGAALGASDSGALPGQVTLVAVDADEPAGKPVAQCEKRTIRLTVHRGASDDACLQEKKAAAFRRSRIPDLCQEAHQQGALLSSSDLSELLGRDNSTISSVLVAHEKRTGKLVPRRATLHDVGTGLTHKRIICWKRYAEGKPADVVGRETYHSLEAVDRYLGQFDRVRHCRREGMSPEKTAFTLNCSVALVKQYLTIDQELEGKQP